jgi:hypothetical protein
MIRTLFVRAETSAVAQKNNARKRAFFTSPIFYPESKLDQSISPDSGLREEVGPRSQWKALPNGITMNHSWWYAAGTGKGTFGYLCTAQ